MTIGTPVVMTLYQSELSPELMAVLVPIQNSSEEPIALVEITYQEYNGSGEKCECP